MNDALPHATIDLKARLQEPDVAQAINRLLDRIDTLEKTVDKLAMLTEETPALGAMVTDMVDESMQKAQQKGVNIEARFKTALALVERLTAPHTTAALNQVLDLTEQAPAMLAMMADITDETFKQANKNGATIDSKLKEGITLLNRLTEPQTIEMLTQTLALAEQAPQTIAMVADILDETAQRLDMPNRISSMNNLFESLSHPTALKALEGILDVQSMEVVAGLGEALKEAKSVSAPKLSPFGLYRAMKDENVQKAMGFLIQIAKNLGKTL